MLRRPFSFRKLIAIIAILPVALTCLIAIIPVSLSLTRALHLITLLVILIFAAMRAVPFLKPRRMLSSVVICLVVLLGIWAISGGKQIDQDSLRRTYINRLLSFKGTRYFWGGESRVGIDCSGLARTALWQSMAIEGIKEANPRLLGPTLWKFWWHDLSANMMSEGVYSYTKPIGHADKLSLKNGIQMKPGFTLREGDIAVGGHVMIYIGNGEWIEASPENHRVVANKAVDSPRGYFNVPVIILRWWLLEDQKQ